MLGGDDTQALSRGADAFKMAAMPHRPLAVLIASSLALAGAIGCARDGGADAVPLSKNLTIAGVSAQIERDDFHFEFEPAEGETLRFPVFDGVTAEPVTGRDLQARLEAADVIVLGEVHDDRAGHDLQARLTAAALPGSEGGGALTLEMLERGDSVANLEESALSEWTNWEQAYLPTIRVAQRAGRPVVPANAPREYVTTARVSGYETLANLDPSSRRQFALPPEGFADEVDSYRQRFVAAHESGHTLTDEAADEVPTTQPGDAGIPPEVDTKATVDFLNDPTARPTATPRAYSTTQPATQPVRDSASAASYFEAQLLWDATMAESIYVARRRYGAPVVHLVGSFHSDYNGGLTELLRRRNLEVLTISLVPVDAPRLRPIDVGRADVVIYTGVAPIERPASEPTEEPTGRIPAAVGEGPLTDPVTRPALRP